ncbi:MAG: ABC transporter substrate-binding protein [Rhizobiales bacterium]|nr:ABC transporter substrate-binding protein [Hyphomicrobiales bacterium]
MSTESADNTNRTSDGHPFCLSRRSVLTAGAAGLALSFMGGRAFAAGKDTLVVTSGADAVTLDPGASFDGQSPLLWRGVYESLLDYKGDTLEFVPSLAESYDVSDDKKTYTFRIRKNVKFTDGEVLDAAAVKFNIERQIKIKLGIAFALGPVTSIETPDNDTVVLKLKEPSDGFLSAFASLVTVGMISPKAIRDNEKDDDGAQDWLRSNMVGTGPYMMRSYTQSQQAVMVRNPDYWRGWEGDHFERIIVKYVHEASSARLFLEQGETDVALFMPDDVVESLDGKPGLTVTNVPSFDLYYLMMNCKHGPTADVRVRRAIAHGFNYDAFIQGTLRGKAKRARGPVPSNFVGHAADMPIYDFDPEKAKKMLAEAGFPDGGFKLKYTYESGYFWKRPLGELFQSNMKDLGIEVEIQELSPAAWAGLLSNPDTADHSFGVVWWPTLATPYDYLWSLFHTDAQGSAGYNWGYYSNPDVDKLLNEGMVEPDEAKRFELYARAQKLIVEDSPALFVYEKNYRMPASDKLKGFVFNGMRTATLDFYNLSSS